MFSKTASWTCTLPEENMIAAYLIAVRWSDYLSSSGFSKPTNETDPQVVIQFQTVGESGKRPRLKFWLPEGNCYKLKNQEHWLVQIHPWQQDNVCTHRILNLC